MPFIGNKPTAIPLSADDLEDNIISTAKIQDNAVTPAKYIEPIPFRNIIINGDMSIAQRGTSTSSVSTTQYPSLDRWQMLTQTAGSAVFTLSQDTDVPSGQGFAKSQKIDVTTAHTYSSNHFTILKQRIEGQMVQYLKKGTSNATSLTLSFWVKSNKTGTYIAELFDADNTRQISKSYTISSANTWEKKTITYAGDTSGALVNDNTESISINLWLSAGSDYTSGTLSTTWTSSTNANRTVGQVNLGDSTANEWYITGVQLEAGTSASDFEFLPVDVNLQRCQRYYYKSYGQGTGTVPVTSSGWIGSRHAIAYQTNNLGMDIRYPAPMRSSPTVTLYHQDGTSAHVYEITTGGKKAVTGIQYGNDSGFWNITASAVFTVNAHYYFQVVAVSEL